MWPRLSFLLTAAADNGSKPQVTNDHLVALVDQIARQDEHSNVARETRRKIAEVIEVSDGLDVLATARRAVRELGEEELAQALADWLDFRVTI